MPDRLTPLARDVLEARNRVIKALSHLGDTEAIMALQYAVASHLVHIANISGHSHAACLALFSQQVRETLARPAGLVVPVRATNPPPRC